MRATIDAGSTNNDDAFALGFGSAASLVRHDVTGNTDRGAFKAAKLDKIGPQDTPFPTDEGAIEADGLLQTAVNDLPHAICA